MGATLLRPIVVGPQAGDPCGHCTVRHESVCNAIDVHDLSSLAAVAVAREYERGHVFIDEGEPATDFFNITSGSVKLFKLLPDGRQQVTGFAGVGHFLGLAVSATYAFSAEAIERVKVCRFSRPKLRVLLDDFPLLEKRLLETACNELASAQEQMLLLGRKTARERVASFLMARSRDEAPCGGVDHIHLPMTRAEIADYLGLTIETVSRTLSLFRNDHRISTPSNRDVVILDRRWLQNLAAGMMS